MIFVYVFIGFGFLLAFASVVRPVIRNALRNFNELRDAVIPSLVVCGIAILIGGCGTVVAFGMIHK